MKEIRFRDTHSTLCEDRVYEIYDFSYSFLPYEFTFLFHIHFMLTVIYFLNV